MSSTDFTISIQVPQTPEEVYSAINNVRGWWSGEIEGSTDTLGEEFTYRYKDMHRSVQKVTELVPGQKVVWHVTDASITFTKKKDEWKDTDIIFEILPKDGQTELRFTHKGLATEFECYEACSSGWTSLITENLKKLIADGGPLRDVFAHVVR